MTHRTLLRSLLLPGLLAPAWLVLAEDAPAPAPPVAAAKDGGSGQALLAATPFTSESAGISFQPPAGWAKTSKPGDPEIATFSNDKDWTLRVTTLSLNHSVPLIGVPAKGNAPAQKGMLDVVVDNIKQSAPDADVLRDEVYNVGRHFVGLVIARYTLNGKVWLRQQAMVQANEEAAGGALGEGAGRLYYVLNLITPAGSDEEAKLAADTFSATVDTVTLLDRTQIRQDQDLRLYRTRAAMIWNRERYEKILVPKQYLRILKDGKEIGYVFREELLDNPNLVGVSTPGPIAYERTHLEETDEKGLARTTDAGIFRYTSFDLLREPHERWTRSVVVQSSDAAGHRHETHGSEFGESLRELRRTFVKEEKGGFVDPKDPKAPPSKMSEVHWVDVISAGKEENGEPVHRDVPGWYLPQAAWYFLPRLLVDPASYAEKRTYYFAVYDPNKREVMSMYVDKSAEEEVTFAGRKVQAVTVTERMGLGGSPVVHYLTRDGKYLGTEDKAQHLLTVVADEKEILARWPKANLTRPEVAQPPEKASSAVPTR